MRIHSEIPISYVNGPGARYSIWFQGCKFNCPGCFNPDTHSLSGGYETTVDSLIEKILSYANVVEGISISGGEPFLQAKSLLELLSRIKENSSLTILVFTGFDLKDIQDSNIFRRSLEYIDVLIAGRYIQNKRITNSFLSSSNQELVILSERYKELDFMTIPETEVIIDEKGKLTISGKKKLAELEEL